MRYPKYRFEGIKAKPVLIQIGSSMPLSTIGQRRDLSLVTNSQDRRAVEEMMTKKELRIMHNFFGADEHPSFFVKVGDGDYDEIFAFEGEVPFVYKSLLRLR